MSSADSGSLEGVVLRPAGTLVDRAMARLTSGPVSTARIAEEVLALRGNPRAAAAAVFALLGSDPRLRVDGNGVWSLLTRPAPSGAIPLRLQEWVVVDVETTGGSAGYGHRVIEVAAVRVSGGTITATYSSLVNPARPLPRVITSLTGITAEMVDTAPPFSAIAERLETELSGRVFVGHNAGFDWRFVSGEMERCTGRSLAGPRVCTLRMARRILAHLPSRSLGSLAEYFGIRMDAHHRALDDAVATARLLLALIDLLEERGVSDWAGLELFLSKRRRRRRRSALPRPTDTA